MALASRGSYFLQKALSWLRRSSACATCPRWSRARRSRTTAAPTRACGESCWTSSSRRPNFLSSASGRDLHGKLLPAIHHALHKSRGSSTARLCGISTVATMHQRKSNLADCVAQAFHSFHIFSTKSLTHSANIRGYKRTNQCYNNGTLKSDGARLLATTERRWNSRLVNPSQ